MAAARLFEALAWRDFRAVPDCYAAHAQYCDPLLSLHGADIAQYWQFMCASSAHRQSRRWDVLYQLMRTTGDHWYRGGESYSGELVARAHQLNR